jgi:hypothetical protein
VGSRRGALRRKPAMEQAGTPPLFIRGSWVLRCSLEGLSWPLSISRCCSVYLVLATPAPRTLVRGSRNPNSKTSRPHSLRLSESSILRHGIMTHAGKRMAREALLLATFASIAVAVVELASALVPHDTRNFQMSALAGAGFLVSTWFAVYLRFPLLSLLAVIIFACVPSLRGEAANGIVLLTHSLLVRTRFFQHPSDRRSAATVSGWLTTWSLLFADGVSDHRGVGWRDWCGPILTLIAASAFGGLAIANARREAASADRARAAREGSLLAAFAAGVGVSIAGFVVYFAVSLVVEPPESVGGSATRTVTRTVADSGSPGTASSSPRP